MTLRFDRGLPPAAALALFGGILALGALLLPWYVLDPKIAQQFLQSVTAMLGDTGYIGERQGQEMQSALQTNMPQILKELESELVGYKVFSTVGVLVHALAAGGALLVALKVWSDEGTVQQQRSQLFAAAGLVCVRPALALLRDPSKGDGFPGMPIPDHIFAPGIGIWVALAGAALIAAGALLVREGSTVTTEWTDPAGASGGTYVPGGPPTPAQPTYAPALAPHAQPAPAAYAQPAAAAPAPQAYVPPAPAPAAPPAFGQPAPTYYTPGGAYGEEGPGTLDRDSRIVRPNDPYAPKPLAAPAVPIPPAPAAITPVNDPSPVVETPGSTYGVPAPQAPAPQAPTRPGSTAPPGFA